MHRHSAGVRRRSAATSSRRRHGQQVGIGLLHPRQSFGRLHHPAQAIVIVLVGGRARRASAERDAHGDVVLLFRHVLMNGVVGEARKRAPSAGDEQLDLVGVVSLRSLSKMEAA